MIPELKKRVIAAMKSGQTLERDILRVTLGELQNHENRHGTPPTDEESHQIIKKLIKSNEESLAVGLTDEMRTKLTAENVILGSLLPKRLSVAEIAAALQPIAADLRAAKGDGPATGLAMKKLKADGLAADGKDVGEAVKTIRAG